VPRRRQPIVGPDVRDQRTLRPRRPIRNLGEFLEFLERVREVTGPVDRPRPLTKGKHFLL
jgi:hypothetical protein